MYIHKLEEELELSLTRTKSRVKVKCLNRQNAPRNTINCGITQESYEQN